MADILTISALSFIAQYPFWLLVYAVKNGWRVGAIQAAKATAVVSVLIVVIASIAIMVGKLS